MMDWSSDVCSSDLQLVRNLPRAVLDVLQNRLVRVQLRLLRQIADRDILARPCLPAIIGIDAGPDLHQGRLARAVGADDADLRPALQLQEIGSASGRERVCPAVSI